MLGNLGRITESLEIAKLGIMFCKYHQISNSLSNLYYAEMLGHLHQGEQEKTFLSAVKCLANCISSGNSVDLNIYVNLIQGDLGINPFLLFNHAENSLKRDDKDT